MTKTIGTGLTNRRRLKERRRQLLLTQKQFGERVGKCSQTVSRWERGEIPIPHAIMMLTYHMARTHGQGFFPGGAAECMETAEKAVEDKNRQKIRLVRNAGASEAGST